MNEIRQWTIEDTIKHEEGYSIASFHLDHAIYVLPDRREVEVNIQGVSANKQEAILLMAAHTRDFPQLERDGLVIFHARRSSEQEKTPETWYWTEAQIQDDLNDPDDEDEAEEIRPKNSRKNEIIVLGHELGKTQAQIQAQLRAEGFSEEWSESVEHGQRIISFPGGSGIGLLQAASLLVYSQKKLYTKHQSMGDVYKYNSNEIVLVSIIDNRAIFYLEDRT